MAHRIKISLALAIASLAGLLLSCRDYGTPGGSECNLMMDMVTFTGSDNTGSHFLLQDYEDSPMHELFAAGYTDASMKPGKRYMIQYYNTDASTGSIHVSYRLSVITDTLRFHNQDVIYRLNSNPIKLNSIWRTGDYININARVQVTDTTRLVALVAAKQQFLSASGKTATATFIDDILGAHGYYYRQAYFSFSTTELWEQYPDCDTLRIMLNDENFPAVKYYEFTRPVTK